MSGDGDAAPVDGLELDEHDLDGWHVVAVVGEVDMLTSPVLKDRLLRIARDQPARVVLDLRGVQFFDSSGLNAVVSVMKLVRHHGGALRLVCTERRVAKVFEIAGLTRLMPLHDSVESAVSAEA